MTNISITVNHSGPAYLSLVPLLVTGSAGPGTGSSTVQVRGSALTRRRSGCVTGSVEMPRL